MKQIAPRLFVGSKEDFDGLDAFGTEWPIVFLARDPWHRDLLGYAGKKADPAHPEYLFARRGKRLYLNLVDAPDPKYFNKVAIDAAIRFIEEQLAALKDDQPENLALICNQGQSRSAGVGLLYLAPTLPEQFEAAEAEYRKVYPSYQPGNGMREFARIHWSAYRNRRATGNRAETDPNLDKAQQIWAAFVSTFASDPSLARDNLIADIRSALRPKQDSPDVGTPQQRGTDGRDTASHAD